MKIALFVVSETFAFALKFTFDLLSIVSLIRLLSLLSQTVWVSQLDRDHSQHKQQYSLAVLQRNKSSLNSFLMQISSAGKTRLILWLTRMHSNPILLGKGMIKTFDLWCWYIWYFFRSSCERLGIIIIRNLKSLLHVPAFNVMEIEYPYP